MSRPLSLAALTILELTPAQMVTCAFDAGYSHVGIRLIPATPTEQHHDIVGNAANLRELEARLNDTGIKVLDVEIFRLKPDTIITDYEAAVAIACRLGASELLVAGNDPDENRQIESFAAFCELAHRYELRASLEFMPWTEVKDLKQAANIVERTGCQNAGVLIDPFHLSRSRSCIEDIISIPSSQLRYMQFCDVPATIPPTMDGILAEARGERLFPGDGKIDLLGLLRAAPAGIPLSMEVPTQALARTVDAAERARLAMAGTQRLLAQIDL